MLLEKREAALNELKKLSSLNSTQRINTNPNSSIIFDDNNFANESFYYNGHNSVFE